MNSYTINGYTRISKARAHKIWAADRAPVYACPCKLRPGAPWYPEGKLTLDTIVTFDALTRAAETALCINSTTGKYLAYYVEEGTHLW